MSTDLASRERAPARAIDLVTQVTCPHCWQRFFPEEILWISEHVELLGDPLLGPEQQARFLPTRFTPAGDALDARGMPARSLACPKCHLPIPRGMVEMNPWIVSILGAPGSGKSYFLTTMTWQLRRLLPGQFGIAFADADPASNRALNACEEELFLNPHASRVIPLGSLIRKTELQGELYDTVAHGQQSISYPRPYLFSLRPSDVHPNADRATSLARMLCLYDNAGEHFLPGQDKTSSPVTRHLAHSRALLFLFDPTQDARFRAASRRPGGLSDQRLSRQETILHEAAARLRRYAGMADGAKCAQPLVVVLSKYDEWMHLLGPNETGDPWRVVARCPIAGVSVDRVDEQSQNLRRLLLQLCPEIVSAAESLAQDVSYVPVSALGRHVELDPATGLPGIRPSKIEPYWVTVPLLYALAKTLPALVARVKRK